MVKLNDRWKCWNGSNIIIYEINKILHPGKNGSTAGCKIIKKIKEGKIYTSDYYEWFVSQSQTNKYLAGQEAE